LTTAHRLFPARPKSVLSHSFFSGEIAMLLNTLAPQLLLNKLFPQRKRWLAFPLRMADRALTRLAAPFSRLPRWSMALMLIGFVVFLTGCEAMPSGDDLSSAAGIAAWTCEFTTAFSGYIYPLLGLIIFIGICFWALSQAMPQMLQQLANFGQGYGMQMLKAFAIILVAPVVLGAIMTAIGGASCG
jgi:hypothetical protein